MTKNTLSRLEKLFLLFAHALWNETVKDDVVAVFGAVFVAVATVTPDTLTGGTARNAWRHRQVVVYEHIQ